MTGVVLPTVLALADLKPYIVLGLAVGGLIAVSGVGLVVVYRTTGVVNLAYGAIGALSTLLTWELINNAGVNQWLAYALCILCGGVVTLAYGMLLGPALAQRDPLVKAIATLGLALIVLGAMSWIWGQDTHTLLLPTTSTSFAVFGTRANLTQVIGLGFGVAVTGVTVAVLRFTRVGTAMRALADDREITATLGVPVRRIEASAWFGSGLVCGATALLLANLYGLDYVALTFLVISFLAAALIGRMQSVWVTLAAGLAIGVVESCLSSVESVAPYRSMTPFLLAIVALLWFGRHRVVTVTGALRLEAGAYRDARVRLPVRVGTIAGLLAVVLIVLPAVLSAYWVQVSTTVVIYSVVALGAGLLIGRVGLVSLGQIALLAVGGWIALRVGSATALPFPLVILAAGLGTGLIGVLVGLPALRLSGLYLALVTLMGAGAITIVLTQLNFPNGGSGFSGYDAAKGGTGALRGPAIAAGHESFFRYAVVVAALLFALAAWHVRSKPGRAWAAIRQSQAAALAAGVNVTVYKLWAFALASFMTGSVGGLLAASGGGLTVYQFPTQDSLTLLAAVLIGGIYSFWGAVIAGAMMQLLPALLSDWGLPSDLLLILFGLGTLQVLVTAPGGLAVQVPRDLRRLAGLRPRRIVGSASASALEKELP